MHQMTAIIVLILGTLFLGACASTPDQPTTTTYDQQVSRQTDEEFTRTLNER